MNRHAFVARRCAHLLACILTWDTHRDMMTNGKRDGRLRYTAEHEHAAGDARVAQLQRLFQRRECEPVRSRFLQSSGHSNGAMAICVVLEHAHDVCLDGNQIPDSAVVATDPGKIDLKPGRPSKPRHRFRVLDSHSQTIARFTSGSTLFALTPPSFGLLLFHIPND
jgi:hypothetical protein